MIAARLEPFNTFRAVAEAAVGDIEAQRALAIEAVRITQEEPDIDPGTVLREGLVFARLAASHGNDQDLGALLAMLGLAGEIAEHEGDFTTAMLIEAEAVSILASRGHRGMDAAAQFVARHSRSLFRCGEAKH